jgi:2-polyprenyl-3-methyl-5-hydroxy-6-metoxy-1,4-benzoquinol methylase
MALQRTVAPVLSVLSPCADPVARFAGWVASAVPPGGRVLDAGAGSGRTRAPLRRVGRAAGRVVAVDPDEQVLDHPWAQEREQATLEEYAAGRPEPFDVIYAVYVLEHVADPAPFLAAAMTLLRPGGSFFALTLNVRHYFGATTWLLSRLGVEEAVLGMLTGARGHHQHFRTEYRLNSVRTVSHHAALAGFAGTELRCYDATANYAWYLPRGARWIAPTWTRAVYRAATPSLMGHLEVRLTR